MSHDALRTILPVAGLSAERRDAVTFTGGTDPILPTPFRIGVAGAATLAATGLAAADLWEHRTGRRQSHRGRSAPGHRVAAQRPLHEARRRRGLGRRNPIMGVYPTKDGRWSYIHANFPNHRAAALSVLGCEENRDAVARAVAELERRWTWRRRSSPPRAPAAWCGPRPSGRSIRRPPPSPRCR